MKTKPLCLSILTYIFLSSLSCRIASEEECSAFKVDIIQEGFDILKVELSGGLGPYSYEWSNGLGNFFQISVSQTGLYEVTVIDIGTKCKKKMDTNSPHPKTVIVDPLPR